MKRCSVDQEIEKIRRVRHEISAEFGHDPKRLVQHYIEMQAAERRTASAKAKAAPRRKTAKNMGANLTRARSRPGK